MTDHSLHLSSWQATHSLNTQLGAWLAYIDFGLMGALKVLTVYLLTVAVHR